jgi:bacterioferritin (cytochrome b1)
MNQAQVHELLYQALETELGGIHVYQTALQCTVNANLKQEWQKYLEQTETHAEVLRELFATLKLNPDQETLGRQVVRHLGQALVTAMEMALAAGNPEAAQLVAAECVVTAERKDHLNWELLSEVAEALKGTAGKAVQAAHQQVEDEEDEHLYHTTGWSRELWIASLGLPAVLPPPEEEKEVKTAIGAARAKHARKAMLK